jgi:flagellar biosynthesis GTPase FlhF
MERQKALAKSATPLPAPQEMASPWQGAAFLANKLGDVVGQNRAEADVLATRDALAKLRAGIDPTAGPTMAQAGEAYGLDEDYGKLLYEEATARQKEARAAAQESTINTRERQEQIETERRAAEDKIATEKRAAGQELTVNERERLEQIETEKRAAAEKIAGEQRTHTQEEIVNEREKQEEIEKEKRNRNQYIPLTPEVAAQYGIKDPSGFQYNTLTKEVEPIDKSAKTTIDLGGSSLEKELGTQVGKNWGGYLKAATTSAGTMQDMELVKQLLPMAPQGPIIGDIAKAFPGISSAGAAFQSIVNRVAPTLRVEGSGATSDIEYDGMVRSLPNLSNRPEANALIAGMMQAKAQINIERGKIIQQYMVDHDQTKAQAAMAVLDSKSIMTPELQRLISQVGPAGAGATGGDPEVDSIVKKYGG